MIIHANVGYFSKVNNNFNYHYELWDRSVTHKHVDWNSFSNMLRADDLEQ